MSKDVPGYTTINAFANSLYEKAKEDGEPYLRSLLSISLCCASIVEVIYNSDMGAPDKRKVWKIIIAALDDMQGGDWDDILTIQPMKDAAIKELNKLENKDDAPKECPECGHVFQGNGWDGIDAHWRSKHENIMPYEEAWPLITQGLCPSKTLSGY